MRTREEINEILNKYKGEGQGVQQQVIATVLSIEILLDIRELLQKADDVKSFISHLLEQVLEDVESKRIIKVSNNQDTHISIKRGAYNKAIDDVSSSLRTKYLE